MQRSRIVDARTDSAGVRVAPEPDVAGQLTNILALLDACLMAVGSDHTRIVSMTMYCTALEQMSAELHEVFAPWIGEHRPTLTCIGFSRLASTSMLLGVQGTALVA